MQLTNEQELIVASRSKQLVVEARAGSGKTSTLRAYADARSNRKILYVAFNKAIQLEAAAKMPSNVTCRTTHSLAYRKAKQLFGDRDREKVGNTYPSTVARLTGCGPLIATGALQAIQRWCSSLDEDITIRHVSEEIVQRVLEPHAIVEVARNLWKRMLDPHQLEIRMPHDGYLKLFQLEEPVIRGFDIIAVDEAQDLNICTLNIMSRQPSAIVAVGDSAQSIYGFRGAINALGMFVTDERLHLTKSFRFGRGIAHLANQLLSYFKGIDKPIVGAGQPQATRYSVDIDKTFAVIARTNAAIFDEAVQNLMQGRRYHFVGGTEGYKLEKILDAYYLSVGEKSLMSDPYLRSFGTFQELEKLAKESDDHELKQLKRVIDEYGRRIPELIKEIQVRHEDIPKERWDRFHGIFFATAHKSKGLEFEQVWLTDDYVEFFEEGKEKEIEEIDQEEINILYVAVTRAKAAIRICRSFEEWLDSHQQYVY